MAFGVFIHRSDSIYEDSPAERYQFPSQYRTRVEACVGDWIIYYEPRKAQEARGYFAIAKIQEVIADPGTSGMYIAVIEVDSYLDFVNLVPFSGADGLVERGLNDAENGSRANFLEPRATEYLKARSREGWGGPDGVWAPFA